VLARFSPRPTGVLVTAGALGVAVTTALEVVTAPYSPAVVAYPLNSAVHVGKVVAVAVLVVGLLAWAAHLRRHGARAAALVAGVLAIGTPVGAVPYSLAEASLDSSLTPAVADAELAALYERHAWIGVSASIALPVVVLGVVVLAVVVLRRRLVPAWAPIASLVALAVAVGAGVLAGAGLAVPHPPAWVFLGLAGYGLATVRAASAGAEAALPVGAGALIR
jgi:hypothetical protein